MQLWPSRSRLAGRLALVAVVAVGASLAGAAPADAAAPVETTIEAGPSGLTRDTTPSFTFGSSTPGATFECQVAPGGASAAPAFASCSAPLTLAPLPSGEHVLAVRARAPSGELDETPATRAFTVDADPPDTAIVGGPADGTQTEDRSPEFAFGSEPAARFECRLDHREVEGVDSVEWESCPGAGFRPRALESGTHTLEVRAVDVAGNRDPVPAKVTFRVRACDRTVRFGLVEADAACLLAVGTPDAPRWVSEEAVTLNGIPLPAPGTAKVVLTGPTPEAPGGSVTVEDLDLTIAGITVYRGRVRWVLPDGARGDEREVTRFNLAGSGQKLFGLEVRGDVALRLRRTATDRYKAVFALHVALPSVFRAGPEAGAGGLTGDVAIDVDRDGVHLDGLKIAVTNAYIGRLGVKSVCLSFVAAGGTAVAPCQPPRLGRGAPEPFIQCRSDNDADRWDGAAAIVLPTASGTELGVWAGLRAGRLSHAGGYVDNLGEAVPLAPGVFLQRVALGVCLEPPPFQIKGAAGIAFGPTYNGRQAVRLDGSFHYVDAWNGQPWRIRADGSLTMFDRQLANAWFQYQSTGLIDFGFDAQLAFGPVRFGGQVGGWVETQGLRRFNVSGHIRVCVDAIACANATAVISSAGAAGCITVQVMSVPVLVRNRDWKPWAPWRVHWESRPVTITGGAGYTWQTRRLDLMGGSCSIGRWVIARTARAAGGTRTLRVPDGQTAVTLRVRGRGAPPKVTLVGPDGRRVVAPDRPGGALVRRARGSHLIAENPSDDTTSIMVTKPAGGTWRIETHIGSAPVIGVQRADALPEPTVSGGVGGRGHRRVLGYAFSPQPGQRVTFIERFRGGAGAQPDAWRERRLGSPTGSPCRGGIDGPSGVRRSVRCGRLRFRPGVGPAGERQVVAVIEQHGLPRRLQVLGTYLAPPPTRPTSPTVTLRRRGARVLGRWSAVGAAAGYNVVVRIEDGRRLLFVRSARQRSVHVRGVLPRDGVSMEVRGTREDGAVGRDAAVRLPAGQRTVRSDAGGTP